MLEHLSNSFQDKQQNLQKQQNFLKKILLYSYS